MAFKGFLPFLFFPKKKKNKKPEDITVPLQPAQYEHNTK